jgi:SAM-dependent methyltransferase
MSSPIQEARMTQPPWVEAREHPMVLAAMGRLATLGGWRRMLDGKPLESVDDLNDAELLLAAGVLQDADGLLRPVHLHPWHLDPEALAGGVTAALRKALRHAEGGDPGWGGEDPRLVQSQSEGSVSAAVSVVDGILPLLHSSHRAFEAGAARFLDVGVGAGAVVRHVCAQFPGASAVGIDVLDSVLVLARRSMAAAGLTDRVELRHQSVADVEDVESFDLAWLPQQFVARGDLHCGVAALHRSLRPDRWAVLPITAAPRNSTAIDRALRRHEAYLSGGGPISVEAMTELLVGAGFVDVRPLDLGDQVVMVARRGPGPPT